MSQKYSTAIGAALGGAAVAAFVGMGTAHAQPEVTIDTVLRRRRRRRHRGPDHPE